VLAVVVLGFVALNVVAFGHARAMLRFARVGRQTKNPEDLSPLETLKVLLIGVRVAKPTDSRTPEQLGLPFERHSIPVDGRITLGAWLIPHARPKGGVILFHGFTDVKSQLLLEAAAFHARGFSALLVDFRGSGDSSERYTTVGYLEADDVVAAIRYAGDRLGMHAPILYGRSMGACAVLRALALHDCAVSAIVLEGVFDRMLTTVKQRFMSMGVPTTPFAQLLVFWGGLMFGFWAFAHNPIAYAARCRVRALMLHGSEDPRATLAQAKTVFDALAGEKRFVVFPGAKHESLIEFDRARWDAAIDQLLAEGSSRSDLDAEQQR
jgi:alpha-beta hydrolase superfamily lysophospholipase